MKCPTYWDGWDMHCEVSHCDKVNQIISGNHHTINFTHLVLSLCHISYWALRPVSETLQVEVPKSWQHYDQYLQGFEIMISHVNHCRDWLNSPDQSQWGNMVPNIVLTSISLVVVYSLVWGFFSNGLLSGIILIFTYYVICILTCCSVPDPGSGLALMWPKS